ncbi:MAG: SLC13 family permease [Verrucomicrobiota bacterium]
MEKPPVAASPNRERDTLSQRLGLIFGIAGFLVIWLFINLDPENPSVSRMAAIAFLMAVWWITDALPLAATALVPIITFPILGIMSGKEIAKEYTNSIIFLFIGGFLIALAMERWGLHRRIALRIISLVGGTPARLVLGFMLATAFLSMWISNTATAIMMLAIALAVIRTTENDFGENGSRTIAVSLLLGIAYSASIGGMATLVGTPPNLALSRIFEQSFPAAESAGVSLSFGRWMLLGLPLSVAMLTCAWLLLTKVFFRAPRSLQIPEEAITKERENLGPMRREESIVLGVFAATALLWVFRTPLSIGNFTIPGWRDLLPFGDYLDDGTVAIAMSLLLFLIPAKHAAAEGKSAKRLLDATVFRDLPWHIVLLFGGGFALAKGFQSSGLSTWVGSGFAGLGETPVPVLVLAIAGLMTFLTELTSNTATTEMVLPLLASIAQAIQVNPLYLMIPAALSASCAFMMPVATPPNAIVFGSGKIRIIEMVKVGIVLNLVGLIVLSGLFLIIGPLVFGLDAGMFPDWAAPADHISE